MLQHVLDWTVPDTATHHSRFMSHRVSNPQQPSVDLAAAHDQIALLAVRVLVRISFNNPGLVVHVILASESHDDLARDQGLVTSISMLAEATLSLRAYAADSLTWPSHLQTVRECELLGQGL